MKKILQVLNGIALISTVFINYLSNTGALNNTTIGEVSKDLNNLFTPASYAFAIWGLIYLMLFGFIFYQGRSLFVNVRNDDFITKIGGWFIISCVANSAWVFCWIYGYTGISCLFIFLLLFSLLKIIYNNNMELFHAPISVILFLWWPFVFYAGWVTVASIANVAAYLTKVGWNGFGLSDVAWTVIMMIIASILNLIVIWKRNMREFALVGVWALVAIGIANKNIENLVAYTAFVAAAILFINLSIHGYQNRKTNPFLRLNQKK